MPVCQKPAPGAAKHLGWEGGKLSSKTILTTQEKETFLWRDFLCGSQTSKHLPLDELICLGSQGPSQTNLPDNGFTIIRRTPAPFVSTQLFWGLWGSGS